MVSGLADDLDDKTLFGLYYGAFILETEEKIDGIQLGMTTDDGKLTLGAESVCGGGSPEGLESTLEKVFPTVVPEIKPEKVEKFTCAERLRGGREREVRPSESCDSGIPGNELRVRHDEAFQRRGRGV